MRKKIASVSVLMICGLFIVALSTHSAAASVPGVVASVSYDSSSNQVDGYGSSISGDGQFVTFQSDSSSLTPGYTNYGNIFVRDTVNDTTTLVSASNSDSSEPANSDGDGNAQISYDGRYVVFGSTATNLVSGVTSGHDEVYERDLLNNTTILVSAASDGTAANNNSQDPSVTADGRFVVFDSAASNLVSGSPSGFQIYLKDMVTGSVTLLSENSSGDVGNSNSFVPSISCDGGIVSFSSQSSNLVSGDTNGESDIFVDEIADGNNDLNDITLNGDGGSGISAVSCNGNDIAFNSVANNLAGDNDGNQQVYEYNRLANTTSMISVDSSDDAGDNSSATDSQIGVSGDGRYVVFQTNATNLGGSLSYGQVDIRDTVGDTTQTLSVNSSLTTSNNSNRGPAISANGKYVSFESLATNLVSGITTTPAVYKAETGF